MRNENHHLSDEELLLAADGELSARRSEEVNAHLAHCDACCARMGKLQDAAASLTRAYRSDFDPQISDAGGAREALEARMAEFASGPVRLRWWDRAAHLPGMPPLAYVLGIILVAVIGVRFVSHETSLRGSQTLVAGADAAPLLPKPDLTPGATRPVSTNEVCMPGAADQMATIPMPERKAVFHEYGMDGAPARDYEVDHLITPELGGTDDIRNLWPQPYSSATWNAYVKDELEDHLRRMVCDGKLDLSTAQRDIATNWIAAYQKYFHTDRPLANVSSLIWSETHERVD